MEKEIYIGTYNNDENSGIFKLKLNIETGEMSELKQIGKILNPNYIVLSSSKKIIYSVMKKGNYGGVAATKVSDEILEPFSESLSEGHLPCHINIDKKDEYLFSANYRTGIIKTYELNLEGEITRVISEKNHNDLNLGETHPHYIGLTPEEKYLFVVDLGLDMMVLYHYENGKIGDIFQKVLFSKGSGPRHLVFNKKTNYAYMITEYSTEVVTLIYSESQGFKIVGNESALGEGFKAEGDGGAIRMSSNGGKIYTSSRKPGSISMFEVENVTNKPKLLSTFKSEGEHPRDINIFNQGKILVVANRFSNKLVSFIIDNNNIKKSGFEMKIKEPTSIIF